MVREWAMFAGASVIMLRVRFPLSRSKMQAVNAQDFTLLRERSSLCMLPPPLNAVSFFVASLINLKWASQASCFLTRYVLSLNLCLITKGS